MIEHTAEIDARNLKFSLSEIERALREADAPGRAPVAAPDAEGVAAVLAQHQRVTSKPGGPCWCGEWPRDDVRRDTWMDHVAEALAPWLAAHDAAVRAEAWDACTDAHHEYAVRQGLAFAHPPNPYRVTSPERTVP